MLLTIMAVIVKEKIQYHVDLHSWPTSSSSLHSVWLSPPRPYCSAVRFLKNHRSEADDFLIKMGVGVLHIGGLSRKGARHCFSLVMYWFCSKIIFASKVFHSSLKLVSAIFYQIFIFSSNDRPSKTMKIFFYFI